MRGKDENHEELIVKQEYDDTSWTEPILKSGIKALLDMSPVRSLGRKMGISFIVFNLEFFKLKISTVKFFEVGPIS